jgi:prophage antirepressor-like protein
MTQVACSSTDPVEPTKSITQLLLHSFQDHNITVYGTWDNPLFKASEIGEMLGIERIRKTLENIDDDLKVTKAAPTAGGLQEQYFLTEDGLYELLFISRKPLAKTFRRHVCTLLKEERLKLGEESRINILRQIAKEREKMLMEQHKGKSGVYFLKHIFKSILFFGSSHEACNRSKDYKSMIGKNDIFLDKIIETPKYIKLEYGLRKYQNCTYTDLKDHKHTEVIEYKDEKEIAKIYKKTEKESKLIEPPQYSIDLEIEKERTKQSTELTRQSTELTRQLELQIELFKLNNSTPQEEITQEEIIQEEIIQEEIIQEEIIQEEIIQEEIIQEEIIQEPVNKVFDWCRKNIEYNEGKVLKLPDLCSRYFENNPINDARSKGKFRKSFEEYLRKEFQTKYPLVHSNMRNSSFMGKSYKGWRFITLILK